MKHMPITVAVTPRSCPLCGAGPEEAEPYLADSRDTTRLSASSFASRKVPEYMSHAMVRCRRCDLAYVDMPPSGEALAQEYHAADYDSAREAEDAADAYLAALVPVLARLPVGRPLAVLEIGTGTGALLDRLAGAGFTTLVGVEPSTAAIAAAPAHRRGWIEEGVFEAGRFAPASFDLICCFMTLEHVRDPGALVAAARPLLRPGGAFVGVTHDRRAWVNRLLGRRSPIVDVEHMQLFSARSARSLLDRHGYAAVGGASFRNAYRPSYWLRLLPMPGAIKGPATRLLRGTWLDRRPVAINVGNYMSWGFVAE